MKEELIQKLFQGTCSKEELKKLFELIREDPSPPEPGLMERLWEEVQPYPELNEAAFDRMYAKTLSAIQAGKKPEPRSLSPLALGLAAGFALLLALCFWLFQSPPEARVIRTAFGERYTTHLSDGSRVELNANSQMRFREKWVDDADREVWLNGEAFFTVQKKPQTGQKMKVITDDLVVEVLGTTFNVNSKAAGTSVYLQEGSIQLHLNVLDTTILMAPGDLVTYSGKTGEFTIRSREIAEVHTSWKDGVLTFKETPLKEVLRRIEEVYGIRFEVTVPEVYETEVNFPLPIDDLPTAISILDRTLVGINISKRSDQYILE